MIRNLIDHYYHLRGVILGVARGCHGTPRFKGQLTLCQPGEADYAYQITVAYLARVLWVLKHPQFLDILLLSARSAPAMENLLTLSTCNIKILNRDWSPKFETELNIIDQKV